MTRPWNFRVGVKSMDTKLCQISARSVNAFWRYPRKNLMRKGLHHPPPPCRRGLIYIFCHFITYFAFDITYLWRDSTFCAFNTLRFDVIRLDVLRSRYFTISCLSIQHSYQRFCNFNKLQWFDGNISLRKSLKHSKNVLETNTDSNLLVCYSIYLFVLYILQLLTWIILDNHLTSNLSRSLRSTHNCSKSKKMYHEPLTK